MLVCNTADRVRVLQVRPSGCARVSVWSGHHQSKLSYLARTWSGSTSIRCVLVGDSLDLASEGRWCRLADVCEREERSSTVVPWPAQVPWCRTAGAGAGAGAGAAARRRGSILLADAID